MRVVNLIVVVLVCLGLSACGGGGDEGGGNTVVVNNSGPATGDSSGDSSGSESGDQATTENSEGFAELEVDVGFDWQMQSDNSLSFELVSFVSQGRGQWLGRSTSVNSGNDWLSISGVYLVKVFALDSENNVLTNPVFTGMTNQYGQLAVNFSLDATWLGVVVDVDLGQLSCSQTIYRDELSETVQLGCDVVVGSDL